MNDEQNKLTTSPEMPETPDTLTDEQMEDVSGGTSGCPSHYSHLGRTSHQR